jgi:lipopolysaccharide biosynthesis regulator YciM
MNELQRLVEEDEEKAVEKFIEIANSTVEPTLLVSLEEIGKNLVEKIEGHSKGRVLGTLGNISYALNKLDDAEKFYIEALNIYIQLSKDDEAYMSYVAGALFNLGNLYQIRRKYEEAEKAYRDSVKVLETIKNDDQLSAVLVALGTLYAKLELNDEAEKVLMRAFEIKRKNAKTRDDAREIGLILNNLAVIFTREGRRREAEMLLKKAVDIFEELDAVEELSSVLQNLLSILPESEGEGILARLEKYEDRLLPDLRAKIKYVKAKLAEKSGDVDKAASNYLEAACLAFIAYRTYGFYSINFMHCFDKAEELGIKDLSTLKSVILRHYYGSKIEIKEPQGEIGEALMNAINGKDAELEGRTLLHDVARIIIEDLRHQ